MKVKEIKAETRVYAVFSVTIFLSSLLLFMVQPMYARMILPTFGGSSAVWSVSLLFFQTALLAGYAYAHLIGRLPGRATGLVVHGLVMLAAFWALPVAAPAVTPEATAGSYRALLGVLVTGLGLPFFALSANASLIQNWYGRTGHPGAANPYRLYAASNAGSLLALLAYPLLAEPILTLRQQSLAWSAGFPLVTLLVAGCGILSTGFGVRAARAGGEQATATSGRREGIRTTRALSWILLAFIPTALLVSFTSWLTTDLPAGSLLWILPLALFLVTFIIAFSSRDLMDDGSLRYAHVLFASFSLWVAVIQVLFHAHPSSPWQWMVMLFSIVSFFLVCLLCHKELYDSRPVRDNLTYFYLLIAFGGALGGLASAILFPVIFNNIYEYPCLLAASIVLRPGVLARIRQQYRQSRRIDRTVFIVSILVTAVVVASVVAVLTGTWVEKWFDNPEPGKFYMVLTGVSAILLVVLKANPARQAAVLSTMVLVMVLGPSVAGSGDRRERGFFGVILTKVVAQDKAEYRNLYHGRTLHGSQLVRGDDGQVIQPPVPASYYYPGSPMAAGFDAMRARRGGGALTAGIVGLGAGSLACYFKPGDSLTFFEIDPLIVRIARDPERFTFLSECAPAAGIVIGDARQSLQREPDDSFDYLIVDAFSSDAIPVHLLTREALQMYLDKVKEDGIVALHLSNTYMDLVSPAMATIRSLPGPLGYFPVYDPAETENDLDTSSNVLFLSRSEASLVTLRGRWDNIVPTPGVRIWTDDYSNIMSAIWRQGILD